MRKTQKNQKTFQNKNCTFVGIKKTITPSKLKQLKILPGNGLAYSQKKIHKEVNNNRA